MSTAIDDRRRPSFGLQHRLALSREVAGVDQADIARALGVARPTVSNYERGFTKPRRAVLVAWAMATGVDVEWLETGGAPHDGGAPDTSRLRESNPRPIHYMRQYSSISRTHPKRGMIAA